MPGGAANIQDIYLLAPLQEGLLFHHRLSAENRDEGDAYVLPTLLRLDSADHCTAFLEALRQVIARHDILRSAVLWEGLPRPLQVVLRTVELPIEHLPEDGSAGHRDPPAGPHVAPPAVPGCTPGPADPHHPGQ